MPTKLSSAEWKALTARVVPTVGTWLESHNDLLSAKGKKFTARALDKANLASETGTRLLFEPVILVATAGNTLDIDELDDVLELIPFTGDYFQWDYVKATYATAHRIYDRAGYTRQAADALSMVSFPENGEKRAAPLASGLQAVQNRADGNVLGKSQDYPRPVTTIPALQHLIGALREWNIMWALDASTIWSRTRIDASIEQAVTDASGFLA